MYLKRIELMGFKSFPEKIHMEFDRGITAVVGPNGSGKSNMADSVRWVLGEQSAKSLRGAKMEDVIFSGTANRRALGLAEVSMVIDNTDAALPLDFSEIKVTRRVYRSGESEYAINGTPCRMRDVHELFMDTGIGKEGYSIIGQGRIEEILSARSEDRRLLFEEAAGIVKFKIRKQEAESKLGREKENLVRVKDIQAELSDRLEELSPQSEKAKRYLDLREELKALQINLFLEEAAAAEQKLAQMSEAAAGLKEQLEREKERQLQSNEKLEHYKATSQHFDHIIKEANAQLLEIGTLIEQKEGALTLANEKINHILSNTRRVNGEIAQKTESILRIRHQQEAEAVKQHALALQIKSKKEMLEQKLSDFQEFDAIIQEREQYLDQFNANIIELLKKTSDVKGNKHRAEDMYAHLEHRMEQLNTEIHFSRSQITEQNVKLKAITQALHQLEGTFEKLDYIIENHAREKDSLSEQYQEKSLELSQIRKQLNEYRTRHKLLSELERDYEGYHKSVKAILKRKRLAPEEFSGICGAVAELCNTTREFETAIEIVLGSAMQNIVTETEEAATQAIAYLKQSGEGRATFLPMTAIRPKVLADKRILHEKGILGTAQSHLRYEPRYEIIFANLLGQAVIPDSMKNAVSAYKKYKHAIKIVTLEGDLLMPGGAMTGGSINQRPAHIFTRGRELIELPDKIDKFRRMEGEMEHSLDILTQKITTVKEGIKKAKNEAQELALVRNTKLSEKLQAEGNLARFIAQKDSLQVEYTQVMAKLEETNQLIRTHNQELQALEAETQVLQADIENHQSAASIDKEDRDGKTREITEIKVELSSLEEKIRATADNICRLIDEIKEKETDITMLSGEIERAESDKQANETEIAMFTDALSAYKDLIKEKRKELAELEDGKDEMRVKINASETLQKDGAESVNRIANELTKLEMKKEQTELDSRRLYDQMWDEYRITYQAALMYNRLDMNIPQMRETEKKIKHEMQGMGNVNVGAIEEYKSIRARYEHLTEQVNDIIAAEDKLQGIIKTLTELMGNQFREQFRIISENFGIVFKEMFGGGQAALQLSDESNVLTAGIEIIAQPPGKNLQNISLLTGGERALTATALLFGILRMKPSPFCILDEIEAALDDANVNRFAHYLKNFAGDTQFILITHRKGTMEAADTLYGVTMQEQGVSKLVSVKFGEQSA